MKINDLHGHMPGWAWYVLPLVMIMSVPSCGDDDEDKNTDPKVGTDLKQLTTSEDSKPAWSSDASRIAFARRDFDQSAIHILTTATGAEVIRTQPGLYEYAPRWSPDDTKLAFAYRFVSDCGPYGNNCTIHQVSIGAPDLPGDVKIGGMADDVLRPDLRAAD